VSLAEVLARIAELVPGPVPTRTAAPRGDFGGSLARAAATTGGLDSTSAAGRPYQTAIDWAARENRIDPALLESVIARESGFDPSATSAAGAQGLMQLMPSTAASLGVTNPYDPVQSIEAGARYLRSNLDRVGGDTALALAAYNAGMGAVERYGGMPPYTETQDYVQAVLAGYERLTGERRAQ
jgi:soluble lytic murein transglycosylase-like protein